MCQLTLGSYCFLLFAVVDHVLYIHVFTTYRIHLSTTY